MVRSIVAFFKAPVESDGGFASKSLGAVSGARLSHGLLEASAGLTASRRAFRYSALNCGACSHLRIGFSPTRDEAASSMLGAS